MTLKDRINAANEEVLRRIVAADPVLVDVAPAAEVIPGMRDRLIMHSGPARAVEPDVRRPARRRHRHVPVRGLGEDPAAAERMLSAGEIELEPNHHHPTVGPMAGTITRNMSVWVVENRAFGNRAYCRQVEGFQQFGDYTEKALGRWCTGATSGRPRCGRRSASWAGYR